VTYRRPAGTTFPKPSEVALAEVGASEVRVCEILLWRFALRRWSPIGRLYFAALPPASVWYAALAAVVHCDGMDAARRRGPCTRVDPYRPNGGSTP